ncbi:MAG: hypothetical protein PUJ80_10710, partial [Verrucomicrobiota bacterium]|nr:hypothetical protein [Verrucomicrobiota bacterium]
QSVIVLVASSLKHLAGSEVEAFRAKLCEHIPIVVLPVDRARKIVGVGISIHDQRECVAIRDLDLCERLQQLS